MTSASNQPVTTRDVEPSTGLALTLPDITAYRTLIICSLIGAVFFLSVSARALEPTASATAPAIVILEEMQPWPSEFGPLTAGFLDPAIGESVQAQWPEHLASIAHCLTTDSLIGMSRWAKSEMATCTISLEQIAGLTFTPEAQTPNREQILYSQSVPDGIPLPSHDPLVFRRLVLAASFDTAARRISRIFVTIRGWREE